MATFADFIPNMRLEIADLFDEKVEQYLRETMIDFATKTGCLTANAEVALDAGKWGAVIEVETMLTETPFKTLWVKDNLTYLKESGFDGGKSGMPSLYKDLGATLIFDRAPVSPLVFTAFCMVKPKYDATNFNNRFLTDYKEAIEQGALFRVCMTPGGRWFNPEMAQFHKDNYDNLLRQAKAYVITTHNAYVNPVRFV